MTIRNILTEPNKLLRQISQKVDKVGKDEQKLMDDMLETMYSANGIGLAAIQIGVPKRIIVMDLSKEKEKDFWRRAERTIAADWGGRRQPLYATTHKEEEVCSNRNQAVRVS